MPGHTVPDPVRPAIACDRRARRNLNLLNVASVALDGSKFKAVNHWEKKFTGIGSRDQWQPSKVL